MRCALFYLWCARFGPDALREEYPDYSKLVTIRDILPGEELCTAHVEPVEEPWRAPGLYNLQTLHGDVVVGGLRASTYTTAVDPAVAHRLLWPLRAVFEAVGVYTTALDKGAAPALAALAPKGGAVCP